MDINPKTIATIIKTSENIVWTLTGVKPVVLWKQDIFDVQLLFWFKDGRSISGNFDFFSKKNIDDKELEKVCLGVSHSYKFQKGLIHA